MSLIVHILLAFHFLELDQEYSNVVVYCAVASLTFVMGLFLSAASAVDEGIRHE